MDMSGRDFDKSQFVALLGRTLTSGSDHVGDCEWFLFGVSMEGILLDGCHSISQQQLIE